MVSARVYDDYACGLRPMPHGGDHVLADAKAGDRVRATEDLAVVCLAFAFPHSIVCLLQPPVSEREGFMARQLRPIAVLVQWPSEHLPSNLDATSRWTVTHFLCTLQLEESDDGE